MKEGVILNGLSACRKGDAIFIALPVGARHPIAGGCHCDWCKKHPEAIPSWDVLAVGVKAPDGPGTAWTVHWPEFALRA